ncbi:hypothetical protein [Modestobacter marinus]|uniref:hypothetical protein n=1 Tax=Modestobacter marinus TaxID=477641 RepID=UPI001C9817A2|nr:hypothetical protein [Modestobacter marinus]
MLPLRPLARSVETTGLRRPVRLVLFLALALPACAAVLDPALAAAALGCGVVALALVAGLALATRWTEEPAAPGRADAPAAGADALPAVPAAERLPADALGEQLHALHDEYAELTNQALAEDREDLVQELSDEYADRALRLITAGESLRTA